MKNTFVFLIMGLVAPTSFATTFKAIGSETLYYYQPNTSGATEAKMWKSALEICSKVNARESILPIRISEVVTVTDKQLATVTTSAQFKCIDAEGREY